MGSELYIAAIAVGGVMFNMLYWLFSFLRAGTSGLSAQACGAGDRRAYTLVLRRSLLVALSAGVLMILVRDPLFSLLSRFLVAERGLLKVNIVNIAASLILVYVFHLGIPGVATGTLIAQWAGFAAGFLFLHRYPRVRVSLRDIVC